MAPVPFSLYSKSKPFKFIVGPDREELSIHSGLLSQQSAALDALVNNGMIESSDLCVQWTERSYDEAKSKKRNDTQGLGGINFEDDSPTEMAESSSSPPRKLSPDSFLWARLRSLHEKAEKPKKAESPLPGTDEAQYDAFGMQMRKKKQRKKAAFFPDFEGHYEEPKESTNQAEESSQNNEWDDDHTEVFLSHAKLYVLGDYYGIDDLQTLALQKLHKALVAFDLFEDGVSDVSELVKYTFKNTVDCVGGGDRLREVVSLYVACYLNDLWKDQAFRDFVVDIPELGNHLITETLTRLG